MKKLIIDGIETEANPEKTILEVARGLGIEIPTMCYNKALPGYGACRLCLVEVNQNGGKSSIQASCTYPALEGLIVKTNTDRVNRNRRIMAELLLARCPDSKEVKRIANELGVTKVRIEPKNEDCLLCGLCVRMCKQRMGRGAIGFAHRGSKREVQPAFDVQSEVCQTCGACFNICPTEAIKLERITKNVPRPLLSEFECGLTERPAIHIPFAQAVPNCAIVDEEYCVHLKNGDCKVCLEFCEADAINFDDKEQLQKLNVGSLVLTSGASTVSPEVKTEYGYGRYPNVVSSMQFERILSASGPYGGHVQRPSDRKVPKKIAWIQCVGSRDCKLGKGYCSSVCCMYAIKEAVIAKEHMGENLNNASIFYIDIRTYGKDFDKYYEKAKNELGIRFIRQRNANIREDAETHNLFLKYENEDGKLTEEEFDLVVLSIGFSPSEDSIELANKLSIELNKYNFVKTDEFNPLQTSRKGVFIAGNFQGPKDIPETVAQSSGIGSKVGEILKDARWTETKKKEYVPEIDVAGQEPRLGVFICRCGINIGAYVNVPEVVEYAKTLPNVVYVEENIYTCSADTQEIIKDRIKEHKLNRVVVASCTPRTHEPLFRDTIREAGLNKYLFEMANIRDQCSWVHMNEKERATEKAKDLVRMSVQKSIRLTPLEERKVEIIKSGLVIGGGISGMCSALSLANSGFPVTLIEKDTELGGQAKKIHRLIGGLNVEKKLTEMIDEVKNNKNVTLLLSSKIKEIKGYIGNFETIVDTSDGEKQIKHGVVVVATGAKEYQPKEFLFGKDERVITQREFESRLSNSQFPISNCQSIVMIQCVGSRNEEHPWCSRVCCAEAVKNALTFKEKFPRKDVYVLYRDIRTYGLMEDYYQKAREKGVIFIQYDEDTPPEVDNKKGELSVSIQDPILKRKLLIPCDLLVLSAGIIPHEENEELAKMLKVPLNEDGFFLEAHMKLRPVDFASDGVFLCGICHSPKFIDESIAQASAAASRAETILSKDYIEAGGAIAHVNEELCRACGECIEACEFNAVELVEKEVTGVEGWSPSKTQVARVNAVVCKGCGTCNVVCPTGAISAYHFTTEQIESMIKAAAVKL